MSQVQDTNNTDKKEIADEEREKMLNAENTKHTSAVPNEHEASEDQHKPKRKIPIGAIKPSFCRFKSKETCNVKIEDETKKEENADGEVKENENQISEKQATPAKETKPKEKKQRVLDAIRIPLASVTSVFPRKKKENDSELGTTGAVGLASVETLDDGVTEKNAAAGDDGMENVKLDGSDVPKEGAPPKPSQLAFWLEKARDNLAVTGTILAFILLVITTIVFVFCGPKVLTSAPLLNGKYVNAVTYCGLVQGVLEDGAYAFRGIPYALPPVGNLRWKPAELMVDLKHCWEGVKPTYNVSNTCWQQNVDVDGGTTGDEDCLYLDVYTPEVRYNNPLPVVVLIGADTLSYGSPGALQPSARLARVRDMVFVRPNFRMGVFGFLAVEPLSRATHPPSSGNYGLSDIVAALKWVHININHFGGDPKNVVVWGHRAGGTLVSTLITSRSMQITPQNIDDKRKSRTKVNLFSRAWISSGSGQFPMRDLKEAEAMNKVFLDKIHCSDAACLRKKTPEEILAAVPTSWITSNSLGLPEPEEASPGAKHEWLIRDGNIIQEPVGDVWKKLGEPSDESHDLVKIVIGTTAHSGVSLDYQKMNTTTVDESYYARVINESLLGTNRLVAEAIKIYNSTYTGLASMISDIRVVCPLLVFVRSREYLKDVHFYVSTAPRGKLADVDSDVAVIIGSYTAYLPEEKRHFAAIQQLFNRFVWHGDVAQANPQGSNKVLVVEQDVLPQQNYPNCDFWIKKDIVPLYARTD